MVRRLRDTEHLLRLAGLFAIGGGLFAIASLFMVPEGFGRYGHYRPGALDDNRAFAPRYADSASCAGCHDDIVAARQGSRHAAIRCQACHGPLAAHATDPTTATPARPDATTLCLTCHRQLAGRPAAFPQIEPDGHAGGESCRSCHNPHHPEPEGT